MKQVKSVSQSLSLQVERKLDQYGSPLKPYIPIIGRFLLVATFLEDALRIFFQYSDQVYYLTKFRNFPMLVAQVFLWVNVIFQLLGSFCILFKVQVKYAAMILFSALLIQAIGYGMLFEDFGFICRMLSVSGGLLLLLAQSMPKERPFFAGLPVISENKRMAYLQLMGRILLICLFFSVLWGPLSILRIILILVGSIICVMVAVGFKAKWSAAFLVAFLSISNILVNSWWSLHADHPMRDFQKYDFFQTLSVMGGFLLLVGLGPGGMSVDEKKKAY